MAATATARPVVAARARRRHRLRVLGFMSPWLIGFALFFEQRRWRHVGEHPGAEAMRYIRALVAELVHRDPIAFLDRILRACREGACGQ